jgi:hypothetical protein
MNLNVLTNLCMNGVVNVKMAIRAPGVSYMKSAEILVKMVQFVCYMTMGQLVSVRKDLTEQGSHGSEVKSRAVQVRVDTLKNSSKMKNLSKSKIPQNLKNPSKIEKYDKN